MADPASFAKLVPGFDFLQGLMGGAAQGLPSMNQWIAPTLDPDELDKRIRDLRTVQFWLEQNAKMIGATVQALEVQRMTLATLKTMNLPMTDLRESMRAPAAPAAEPAAPAEPEPAAKPARGKAPRAKAPPPAAGIDPMQWWNALTQQFGELASQAMKDMPAAAVAAGAAPATPPKDETPAAPARAPARRRTGSSRR